MSNKNGNYINIILIYLKNIIYKKYLFAKFYIYHYIKDTIILSILNKHKF